MMHEIGASKIAIVLATIGVVAGCTLGIERPTEQLADATSSIQSAEAAGADRYSSIQLATARSKLAQAERLANEGENGKALQLADEAELDAQLAAAKADAEQAKQAISTIRESTQRLQSELTRAQRTNGG